MSTRHTFRDQVAAYLQQHPNQWIPAIRFEAIGGRQAWRSRISDCRVDLGMRIDNRVQRVQRADGSVYSLSEYKFVPASEPSAQALPLGAATV